MSGDLPAISASSYGSTVYDSINDINGNWLGNAAFAMSPPLRQWPAEAVLKPKPDPKPKQEKPVTRRLVQVFIADPDENLPLEAGLLYSGSQKFTDATDQELFFEVDIQTILKAHNDKRVTLINKKIKDRTEYLEAAKIRDLKMVVVNVASF